MPGRTVEEAWRAFRDPIRRTIGALDLTARLSERAFDGGIHFLGSTAQGINFGPALNFTFSFHLEPLQENGEWRMTTRRYDFTLTERTDRAKLVFGWHWHPASRRSKITYPHVHVPSAAAFSTRHIPTGRVSIEDVIMFGFDDLGVTPSHEQAMAIVEANRSRHKQYRSWN